MKNYLTFKDALKVFKTSKDFKFIKILILASIVLIKTNLCEYF